MSVGDFWHSPYDSRSSFAMPFKKIFFTLEQDPLYLDLPNLNVLGFHNISLDSDLDVPGHMRLRFFLCGSLNI